jgi:hypothetical protein
VFCLVGFLFVLFLLIVRFVCVLRWLFGSLIICWWFISRICVCLCACVCLWVCMCVYMSGFVCMCMCTYVCVYACVCVCMCMCVCVCGCVCVCVLSNRIDWTEVFGGETAKGTLIVVILCLPLIWLFGSSIKLQNNTQP